MTVEALDPTDLSPALGGVKTPAAVALKIPLVTDLPPPLVCPPEGGEILKNKKISSALSLKLLPVVNKAGRLAATVFRVIRIYFAFAAEDISES